MQELLNSVYGNLKKSTAEIAELKKEYREYETKLLSGKYNEKYILGTIRPKMLEIKTKIEKRKEAALSSAKELVEAYQEQLRKADELNPEEITPDANLFNIGVKLNARDIKAILSRNENNNTMKQLALRYAKENGVDLGEHFSIGHENEIKEAGDVNTVIDYYSRWIDKENAETMLYKFFNQEENT